MSTLETGKKLVELCKQGKNLEAISTLYDPNVESVEAMAMPSGETVAKGIDAIRGKNEWWYGAHEVHGAEVDGPFPHGDRFIVRFKMDITQKESGQRMTVEEFGLYTVKDDKIVKEEFFYTM